MSKQKFKVGDRVRINGKVWYKPLCGATGTVENVQNLRVMVLLDDKKIGTRASVELSKIEHLIEKHPVIVITSDGKTTTATMRKGKKIIKTATAICSEKDTFDFAEGARIAFDRLQGRKPFHKCEEKKNLFSGKVVCIEVTGNDVKSVPYTVGKVYVCDDMRFTADNAGKCIYGGDFVDDKRIRVGFAFSEAFFIPLVED